tara:strand:+ start:156 stop:458 length:303 start_codon:yes stop_codon:yes gene_type:complete
VGAFSSGPLRNGLKRPTKVSGTPENRRDDPERSKGQIPRISAGFIDYLGEREKNKWCPEEKTIITSNKLLLFFNVVLVFHGGTVAGTIEIRWNGSLPDLF